jgi:hypothetical protein
LAPFVLLYGQFTARSLLVSSGGNDQIVITDPAIDQLYGAMQKLAA